MARFSVKTGTLQKEAVHVDALGRGVMDVLFAEPEDNEGQKKSYIEPAEFDDGHI